MSSSPALSSSTSLELATPPDRGANLMPLMKNLLSVMGGAEASLQLEILKISQAISQFITQITEQFQAMIQRMSALEGEIVTSRAQTQEARRMHEEQMKAIQEFTLTIQYMNQRLGALESRMSLLESSTKGAHIKVDDLGKKYSHHWHSFTWTQARSWGSTTGPEFT
ncbi:MAG TPA: hypothetical protein DCE71_08800 [Parachlamydiales bacterium]|nr:hypothetical protein [Parachlamydiales bacterium]